MKQTAFPQDPVDWTTHPPTSKRTDFGAKQEQLDATALLAWVRKLNENGQIPDKTFDRVRDTIFITSDSEGMVPIDVTRYLG